MRAFAEPQVEAIERAAGLVAPGLFERDDHRVFEILGDVLDVHADVAGDIGDDVAAMRFAAAYPGRRAVITSLAKAAEALNGETGTVITAE